ncbi:hypothetical protein BHE74_00041376, partial [Ensete ventricosum]
VRIGPVADRYTDCLLLGGATDWGYFRPVSTRNRLITVDFERYQSREKEEEGEEKGEPGDPTLLSQSRSSPAGFSMLHGENIQLSRGEENDVSSPRTSFAGCAGFSLRLHREISSPRAGFFGRRCFFSSCSSSLLSRVWSKSSYRSTEDPRLAPVDIFPNSVKFYVENDAVAALASGTMGKLHGCVLIAGTGTIAYGFTEDGKEARAAGAGPVLDPSWARIAALVPIVISTAEDGDEVANRILSDSVQELADSIIAVVRRLRFCLQLEPAVGAALVAWNQSMRELKDVREADSPQISVLQ